MLPAWCDLLGVSILLASLLSVSLLARCATARNFALCAGIGALLILVLLDQSRFQPWAYLAMVLAFCMFAFQPSDAIRWMRLLVVSLYFYSAISKLDYSFLHTIGQQFLVTLASMIHIDIGKWPLTVKLALAAGFPTWELLVALGLSFPKTRIAAVAGAIAMHLALLLILGPWGLEHRLGVQMWNLYFIVQTVFLFGLFGSPEKTSCKGNGTGELAEQGTKPAPEKQPFFARLVVWSVVLLPLLEPLGWFDHWPAWGLYASRTSQVTLLVHRTATNRLPERVRRHLEDIGTKNESVELNLDDWALDAVHAPIYPQARVQLGIAESVILRWNLSHRFMVVMSGTASRFSGKRQRRILQDLSALRRQASTYWINSRPRRVTISLQAEH